MGSAGVHRIAIAVYSSKTICLSRSQRVTCDTLTCSRLGLGLVLDLDIDMQQTFPECEVDL